MNKYSKIIIQLVSRNDRELALQKIYSRYRHILPQRIANINKKKTKCFGSPKLFHVSAFSIFNAGDAILPTAVRDSIDSSLRAGIKWKGLHTSSGINNNKLSKINSSKGLIIGGGGLFLKDTNPNEQSGWQWSCPINTLKAIEVPIVLFAVGYNRFRDQGEFSPIFTEHINLLASKSPFIGLRNHGSIVNMKRYIQPKYHDKIRFQPCPTTIIAKLYPQLLSNKKNDRPIVALNCAFDRSNLRFGNQIGNKLDQIARVVKQLSQKYDIHYYSHMATDNHFLPILDSHEVEYKLVILNSLPKNIILQYQKPDLVIGMRGHSQMIPFGCLTPILSIVSHEKMQWFLNDIEHPEWGVEITDSNFERDLLKKALNILSDIPKARIKIKKAQERLFEITKQNVEIINESLNLVD